MQSYCSPKVRLKESKAGKGLFAKENIKKGELVIDYSTGPGKIIGEEESAKLYDEGFDYMLQIDEERYFAATNKEELEDADFVNHACEPNCGMDGPLKIIAMKRIKKGDEITIDYALLDSSKYKMSCGCGAKNCRKVITGDDWKRKDLQKRFKGYFSPFIEKKIQRSHETEK